MSHLTEEPWFKVTEDLSSQKTVSVEYTTSGGKKTKQSLPVDDATGTIENLIYTMTQWQKFVREANMEDESIVSRFMDVLSGTRLSDWNRFMQAYTDPSEYNMEFLVSLWDEFLLEKTCKHPRDVMIRYFRNQELCKKPLNMDVRDFMTRFMQVWDHAMLLPKGNEATPSNKTLKEFFFLAFPQQHQLEFASNNHDLDTMEWSNLLVFMEARRRIDIANGTIARMTSRQRRPREGDAQREAYRRETRDDDRRARDRHHRRRHGDTKSYRKSGYAKGRDRDERSSRGNDSRRREKRARFYRKDGKDCHLHAPCKHKWSECDQNPANGDKKQRADRRGRDREHRDSDRHDRRREHAHHARDASSDSSRSYSSTDASIRSESSRSAREESDREEHVNTMLTLQDPIPKKKKSKCNKKRKAASDVGKPKKVKPDGNKSWIFSDDSDDETDADE